MGITIKIITVYEAVIIIIDAVVAVLHTARRNPVTLIIIAVYPAVPIIISTIRTVLRTAR